MNRKGGKEVLHEQDFELVHTYCTIPKGIRIRVALLWSPSQNLCAPSQDRSDVMSPGNFEQRWGSFFLHGAGALLTWAEAEIFTEGMAEMRKVFKACLERNLRDVEPGVVQEFPGFV